MPLNLSCEIRTNTLGAFNMIQFLRIVCRPGCASSRAKVLQGNAAPLLLKSILYRAACDLPNTIRRVVADFAQCCVEREQEKQTNKRRFRPQGLPGVSLCVHLRFPGVVCWDCTTVKIADTNVFR